MTPVQLSDAVLDALDGLALRGRVVLPGGRPGTVVVERPRDLRAGEYATGVARRLAGRTGLSAHDLADLLATELASVAGIAAARPTSAGFLTVRLTPVARSRLLSEIVSTGPAYGLVDGVEVLRTDLDAAHARAVAGSADAVGALGAEVLRYAVARSLPGTLRPADDAGPAGAGAWLRASADNPVYDVAHAHARCLALLRNAADLGLGPARPETPVEDAGVEMELVGALAEYPTVVASAVRLRQVERVPRHLETVASALHGLVAEGLVLPRGDEEPDDGHRVRLLLVDAARVVLGNGLDLLGVAAPARM